MIVKNFINSAAVRTKQKLTITKGRALFKSGKMLLIQSFLVSVFQQHCNFEIEIKSNEYAFNTIYFLKWIIQQLTEDHILIYVSAASITIVKGWLLIL